MTTLREAAQQALEAMDKATRFMSDSDYVKLNQAITALRAALPCTYKCEAWPECACAALAQQEQEPVARREWQSLSEEEINELSHTMVKGHKSVNWLARAIEAKLKEKNNG